MNKQQLIEMINTCNTSWDSLVGIYLMNDNYYFMGWWLAADGPNIEDCYLTNVNPRGDESGDVVTINDTKLGNEIKKN